MCSLLDEVTNRSPNTLNLKKFKKWFKTEKLKNSNYYEFPSIVDHTAGKFASRCMLMKMSRQSGITNVEDVQSVVG